MFFEESIISGEPWQALDAERGKGRQLVVCGKLLASYKLGATSSGRLVMHRTHRMELNVTLFMADISKLTLQRK